MTKNELAQKIKAKYPQYSNIDDIELADKIIAKYPVYEKQIITRDEYINNFREQNKDTIFQKPGSNTQVKLSDLSNLQIEDTIFNDQQKQQLDSNTINNRSIGEKTLNAAKIIGSSILTPVESVKNTNQTFFEAGLAYAGQKAASLVGLKDTEVTPFKELQQSIATDLEKNSMSKALGLDTAQSYDVTTKEGIKGAAGAAVESASNFIPGGKGATVLSKLSSSIGKYGLSTNLLKPLAKASLEAGYIGATTFGTMQFGQELQKDNDLVTATKNIITSAGVGAAAGPLFAIVPAFGSSVAKRAISEIVDNKIGKELTKIVMANDINNPQDVNAIKGAWNTLNESVGLGSTDITNEQLSKYINLTDKNIIKNEIISDISKRLDNFENISNSINSNPDFGISLLTNPTRTKDETLASIINLLPDTNIEKVSKIVSDLKGIYDKESIAKILDDGVNTGDRIINKTPFRDALLTSPDIAIRRIFKKETAETKNLIGGLMSARTRQKVISSKAYNKSLSLIEDVADTPQNVIDDFAEYAIAAKKLSEYRLFNKDIRDTSGDRLGQNLSPELVKKFTISSLKSNTKIGKYTYQELLNKIIQISKEHSDSLANNQFYKNRMGEEKIARIEAERMALEANNDLLGYLHLDTLGVNENAASISGGTTKSSKTIGDKSKALNELPTYDNPLNSLTNLITTEERLIATEEVMNRVKDITNFYDDATKHYEITDSKEIKVIKEYSKNVKELVKQKNSLERTLKKINNNTVQNVRLQKRTVDTYLKTSKKAIKDQLSNLKSFNKFLNVTELEKELNSITTRAYKDIEKLQKERVSLRVKEEKLKLTNKVKNNKDTTKLDEVQAKIKENEDKLAQAQDKLKTKITDLGNKEGLIENQVVRLRPDANGKFVENFTKKSILNENAKNKQKLLGWLVDYADTQSKYAQNFRRGMSLEEQLTQLGKKDKVKTVEEIKSKLEDIKTKREELRIEKEEAEAVLESKSEKGEVFIGYDKTGPFEVRPLTATARMAIAMERGAGNDTHIIVKALENIMKVAKLGMTGLSFKFQLFRKAGLNTTYAFANATKDKGLSVGSPITAGAAQVLLYGPLMLSNILREFGVKVTSGGVKENLIKFLENVDNKILFGTNANEQAIKFARQFGLVENTVDGRLAKKNRVERNIIDSAGRTTKYDKVKISVLDKTLDIANVNDKIFNGRLFGSIFNDFKKKGLDDREAAAQTLFEFKKQVASSAEVSSVYKTIGTMIPYAGITAAATRNIIENGLKDPLSLAIGIIAPITEMSIYTYALYTGYSNIKEIYDQMSLDQRGEGVLIPLGNPADVKINSKGEVEGAVMVPIDQTIRSPFIVAQTMLFNAMDNDPSGYTTLEVASKYGSKVAWDLASMGLISNANFNSDYTTNMSWSQKLGNTISNTPTAKIYGIATGSTSNKYRSAGAPSTFADDKYNPPSNAHVAASKLLNDLSDGRITYTPEQIRDTAKFIGTPAEALNWGASKMIGTQTGPEYTNTEPKNPFYVTTLKPNDSTNKDSTAQANMVKKAEENRAVELQTFDNNIAKVQSLFTKYNVGEVKQLVELAAENKLSPEEVAIVKNTLSEASTDKTKANKLSKLNNSPNSPNYDPIVKSDLPKNYRIKLYYAKIQNKQPNEVKSDITKWLQAGANEDELNIVLQAYIKSKTRTIAQ